MSQKPKEEVQNEGKGEERKYHEPTCRGFPNQLYIEGEVLGGECTCIPQGTPEWIDTPTPTKEEWKEIIEKHV